MLEYGLICTDFSYRCLGILLNDNKGHWDKDERGIQLPVKSEILVLKENRSYKEKKKMEHTNINK